MPLKTYTYDEIRIGQSALFTKQITSQEMHAFSELTGDRNPLHLDKEYAKQTKFGKPVVFGLLVNSLWSTMAGMHLPGKHSLILSIQSYCRKPCFEGDLLTVEGTVKQKVDAGKLIVLAMSVKNQKNEVMVDGEMKVQVLQ